MEIQTSCPACGAPLAVDSDKNRAACKFCGGHFGVDFSETEPRFTVILPEYMAESAQPSEGEIVPFTVESGTVTTDLPSFSDPFQAAQPARLLGKRLWLPIALAVSAVFCGSCLCMGVIARLFLTPR